MRPQHRIIQRRNRYKVQERWGWSIFSWWIDCWIDGAVGSELAEFSSMQEAQSWVHGERSTRSYEREGRDKWVERRRYL